MVARRKAAKIIASIKHSWLSVILFLIANTVYAGDAGTTGSDPVGIPNKFVTASDFLINIAAQVPYLMSFVTALAYIMGMYLVVAGVMKLKHMGESRTMMSQEHSVKGPLILLAVGAMLLYLPSTVQMGMSTFWTEPSPYPPYAEDSDQWRQFIDSCFLIIQLVGVIAFIRGLVILSHLGGHGGGHQGAFSKGMTHIIGGILCINIYQFVQTVMTTLGFDVF